MMRDEQREVTPTSTTAAAPAMTAARPVKPKWGDPLESIPLERQAELRELADQQAEWAKQEQPTPNQSPLAKATRGSERQPLTGAEVFFLAAYALARPGGDLEAEATRLRAVERDSPRTWVPLRNLHLEGANLSVAHLEGASLDSAHLEDSNLSAAHLEGAFLGVAHLEGAVLGFAHLKDANLHAAHLKGTVLSNAHLEGADLALAHLEGASLIAAHLEGAALGEADLKSAALGGAHLEGASLSRAHLEGASLVGAWLDSKTVLSEAFLNDQTRLADIQWSGVGAVNLTQIRWERVPRLGDERDLDRPVGTYAHEQVVRAYRQLAAQLRAQGMSEVADRFTYRAQVCQRLLQRRQRSWGGYLFSLLLAAMAGYGYRLGRIAVAYALVVVAFAASYFLGDLASGTVIASGPSLMHGALDALQISLNAIHGRVFFVQFGLDTLQSWLATIESIFGIVIEGVFVAMLIQRFFGAK